MSVNNGHVSGKERLIIGLVSGSSVDGIDAGLVSIDGTCENSALKLRHFVSVPFDAATRRQLLDLFHYETATIDRIVVAHAIMGELFSEAALQVAAESGTPMSKVDAIGVWGQMMYHRPAHVAPFEWRGKEAGGELRCGARNKTLLRMLRDRLGCTISTHEDHSNPSDAIETMVMAFIANETSLGHTN